MIDEMLLLNNENCINFAPEMEQRFINAYFDGKMCGITLNSNSVEYGKLWISQKDFDLNKFYFVRGREFVNNWFLQSSFQYKTIRSAPFVIIFHKNGNTDHIYLTVLSFSESRLDAFIDVLTFSSWKIKGALNKSERSLLWKIQNHIDCLKYSYNLLWFEELEEEEQKEFEKLKDLFIAFSEAKTEEERLLEVGRKFYNEYARLSKSLAIAKVKGGRTDILERNKTKTLKKVYGCRKHYIKAKNQRIGKYQEYIAFNPKRKTDKYLYTGFDK